MAENFLTTVVLFNIIETVRKIWNKNLPKHGFFIGRPETKEFVTCLLPIKMSEYYAARERLEAGKKTAISCT